MDLSEAFDTLNQDLLLAKLRAYGFDRDSLKVFHSYLIKEYHKVLFLVLSYLIFM